MASEKYIIGLFDHEDSLVKAVRAFRTAGIEITDALTPFPVHGLEHELGYEDTRLHTAGFMFGATGLITALVLMFFISTMNYPTNYGGKPFFALPAFIPITFELTILMASVGMVVTYCIRNGLFPGNVPRIYDERITDDRFALTFEVDDSRSLGELNSIKALLRDNGAVEIKGKEFSDADEIFESGYLDTDFGEDDVPVATPASQPAANDGPAELTEEEIEERKQQLLRTVGAVRDDRRDDLKRIKGIGPVYETRLNEIGIYSFEQIAKLEGEAIEAVEALTGFPGRVEREQWVEQATQFLNERNEDTQ